MMGAGCWMPGSISTGLFTGGLLCLEHIGLAYKRPQRRHVSQGRILKLYPRSVSSLLFHALQSLMRLPVLELQPPW